MREAWAFKAGVFYGPCSTFREAWSVLESTPGPDGYVLGPTSPDFCRRWIGSCETRGPFEDTPDPVGGFDPSAPGGWDNSTGQE